MKVRVIYKGGSTTDFLVERVEGQNLIDLFQQYIQDPTPPKKRYYEFAHHGDAIKTPHDFLNAIVHYEAVAAVVQVER